MEFLLQPGVYRTGDASTLLKLLDNMWIKDHSVGAGTLYIISGFANYNGGVRFYPYFTRHVQSGGICLFVMQPRKRASSCIVLPGLTLKLFVALQFMMMFSR